MQQRQAVSHASPTATDWFTATRKLRHAKRVCVVGHMKPDADAIGSVSAMVMAARSLGIAATGVIGQAAPIDASLCHIPGALEIVTADSLPHCDLVVVVDCGSAARTGLLEADILRDPSKVILVDHHDSNPGFGGINLLDPAAESTTTVLREWFRYLGIQLTQPMAHALYAGLATDTGGFRWGRPQMHEFAQELLSYELDIREVSARLFDGGSVRDLTMVGSVLADLQIHRAGQYSVVVAVASFDRIEGHHEEAVEGLATMIRGVREADVVAVFKEYQPSVWTVSLRADHLDVANVATGLGGGGHKHSAGYTDHGSESAVLAGLLEEVSRTSSDSASQRSVGSASQHSANTTHTITTTVTQAEGGTGE